MVKLVMTYGSRAKKLKCDHALEAIKNTARSQFEINGSFRLQYFDTEVDEWIDLDADSIHELGDPDKFYKVKVVEDIENVIIIEDSLGTCTPASSTTKADDSFSSSLTFSPSTSVNRSSTPSITGTPDMIDDSPRMQDSASFSSSRYPTSERYNAMVDSLFREYPHLAHGEGVAMQSARELWKERLLNKFQNSRKRQDKNLPEVVANKRQNLSKKPKTETDAGPSVWGLKNYKPKQPVTEDDTTVTKHVEWLQKEFKKKEGKDMVKVDFLMDLTLYHRRKQVIEDQSDVESILTDYPWLKSLDELIKEFIRLEPSLPDLHVSKSFLRNLDRYATPILNLTKGRKGSQRAEEILGKQALLRSEAERGGLVTKAKKMSNEIQHFLKTHTVTNPLPKANDINIIGSLKGISQAEVDEDDADIDLLVNFLCKTYSELRNVKDKDLPSLIHDVVNFVKGNDSEGFEATTRCAAILSLPILFREKIDSLILSQQEFCEQEEPEKIVIIKEKDYLSNQEGSFKVTVENIIVCQCSDMVSSILGLLMTIYTFNLAYPKKLEKTLLFAQKVLLGLNDEQQIDRKILNVVSMLNQEMSTK